LLSEIYLSVPFGLMGSIEVALDLHERESA